MGWLATTEKFGSGLVSEKIPSKMLPRREVIMDFQVKTLEKLSTLLVHYLGNGCTLCIL